MRRVDERVDALSAKMGGETVDCHRSRRFAPARLRLRLGGASGERQRHREIVACRQARGERSRFGRAAEDEDLS